MNKENLQNPEPTECTICGKFPCDDWMYRYGLVSANNSICEECKFKIGEDGIKKLEGKA